MTSAYVLIAAILVLGGVLAALGDRLGSKVGKARLSIFNLRPRQTAVVMTLVTGVTIAGSTLGIIFALSESLRDGVFRIDEIHKKRREAERALGQVAKEKQRVEAELKDAQAKQEEIQQRLKQFTRKFQQARLQLKQVSQQALVLRKEVGSLLGERKQLLQQRQQLTTQLRELNIQTEKLGTQVKGLQERVKERDQELESRRQEILAQEKILAQQKARLQELEAQRGKLQDEIGKRDEMINGLDSAIASKDQALKGREAELNKLETQITYLNKEVAALEQYYENYQTLRQGDLALLRGQVLAFALVRITNPKLIYQTIDGLLAQANRNAIEATRGKDAATQERVVQITESQVKQLIEQIKDGQDYVVRIISAGNYVQGELEVRVFADAAINQQIFRKDEEIATISLDKPPEGLTKDYLQSRVDLLLAAAQFRARRAGILGEIKVEDGQILTLINFLEKINASDLAIDEIKVITTQDTYTAGPLQLKMIALEKGEVVLRS